MEANRSFDEAQGFGFALLSDADHRVGRAYEVLRDDDEAYAAMAQRLAYLVDPSGRIAVSYRVSDVHGFAGQVLDDLARLKG